MDDLEFRARYEWAAQKAAAGLGIDPSSFRAIEVNAVTQDHLRWHMTDQWAFSSMEEEWDGIVGYLRGMPVYLNNKLDAFQIVFEAC